MRLFRSDNKSLGKGKKIFLNYFPLYILAFYAIAPLFLLLMNSFKSTVEMVRNPFGFPQTIRFSNYLEAWRIGNFATTLPNSIVIVTLSVTGVLIISFMAAYALARYVPLGYNFFLTFIMFGNTIPVQLYLVPLFIGLAKINLLDNMFVLSILYIAKYSPFATFLLRAFLMEIPREFEEAARVDGASEFQLFTKLVVPLSVPGLITVALVTALRVWNEFTLAVTMIYSEEFKPVSTSLYAFQQKYETNWGLTNAGAVITVLPILILFVVLQRRFIEGLTQGGVKG